jgi:hypothetical protein
MEPFRLRMKIGVHEFEAEGDQESVERQFALWREMVTATPSQLPSPPPRDPPPPGNGGLGPVLPVPLGGVDPSGFEKIIRRDGKSLSLSVLPHGDNRVADAALVLMIAHKAYNQLDQVGGGALLEGLQQSGYDLDRVDRAIERYIPEFILRSGVRRAVKYRLSNPGLNRAINLARELMDMVP